MRGFWTAARGGTAGKKDNDPGSSITNVEDDRGGNVEDDRRRGGMRGFWTAARGGTAGKKDNDPGSSITNVEDDRGGNVEDDRRRGGMRGFWTAARGGRQERRITTLDPRLLMSRMTEGETSRMTEGEGGCGVSGLRRGGDGRKEG